MKDYIIIFRLLKTLKDDVDKIMESNPEIRAMDMVAQMINNIKIYSLIE